MSFCIDGHWPNKRDSTHRQRFVRRHRNESQIIVQIVSSFGTVNKNNEWKRTYPTNSERNKPYPLVGEKKLNYNKFTGNTLKHLVHWQIESEFERSNRRMEYIDNTFSSQKCGNDRFTLLIGKCMTNRQIVKHILFTIRLMHTFNITHRKKKLLNPPDRDTLRNCVHAWSILPPFMVARQH